MAPLPPPELPPGTLILFESIPEGPDRSGGYRFAVTEDGRFLHSGNRALHVEPSEAKSSTDPTNFWTDPLTEAARFPDEAMQQIRQQLPDLPEHTKRPPGRESEPTTERLTIVKDGRQESSTFSPRARPDAAQKLLEAVERAGRSGP
jgi:hypothetical protein